MNPGIGLLSDSLYGTAILGGGAENPGVINQGGDLGQVDPNLDPELAMALRISLEEDKERQKKMKDEEEVNIKIISNLLILPLKIEEKS